MAADPGLHIRRTYWTLTQGLYTTLTRTTQVLVRSPLLHRPAKLSRALTGRWEAAQRWLAWSRQQPRGSLIWVHAASVGETLTAVPIVERIRAVDPQLRFILSYSSPSAAEWRAPEPFVRADYVPPDNPDTLEPLLSALQPAAIVFSRSDLWPNLVALAAAKRIPMVVAGGSVSPKSLRLCRPVRNWLRPTYARLDFVTAVSRSDAARFTQLGVRRGRIAVTGDPRHDYAIERPVRLEAIRPFVDWAGGDPVIVAGSTDAPDERLVTEAFSLVAERRPELKLVLVPHEPERAQRVPLANHRAVLWSGAPAIPAGTRVVVVARLGLLADLYLIASIAHVGGGFRRSGVHSVVEPAVFGIPLSFGPNHRNSPDAEAMLQAGGAVCLPRHGAAALLAARWLEWLERPNIAADAGRCNRGVLKPGASGIAARAVLGLIRSRAPHSLRR